MAVSRLSVQLIPARTLDLFCGWYVNQTSLGGDMQLLTLKSCPHFLFALPPILIPFVLEGMREFYRRTCIHCALSLATLSFRSTEISLVLIATLHCADRMRYTHHNRSLDTASMAAFIVVSTELVRPGGTQLYSFASWRDMVRDVSTSTQRKVEPGSHEIASKGVLRSYLSPPLSNGDSGAFSLRWRRRIYKMVLNSAVTKAIPHCTKRQRFHGTPAIIKPAQCFSSHNCSLTSKYRQVACSHGNNRG
jgi:hypothetical protein